MTYKKLIEQSRTLRQQENDFNKVLEPFDVRGVTKSEWMVLGIIHEGPSTVSKIAKELDSSLAFATNTVNKLEEKGLVERSSSKDDNRVTVLTFISSNSNEKWFAAVEKELTKVLEEV